MLKASALHSPSTSTSVMNRSVSKVPLKLWPNSVASASFPRAAEEHAGIEVTLSMISTET